MFLGSPGDGEVSKSLPEREAAPHDETFCELLAALLLALLQVDVEGFAQEAGMLRPSPL